MTCKWQVEIDPFCRKVLAKHWPSVARYEDVRTVGKHNLKRVDVLCGGFPCQDISNAGKRAGIDGERSGLWSEFHRIICELRPRYVVVENVAALLVRGIGRVLGDLAACGYDAEWECLPAGVFGAPHIRNRLFVVANSEEKRVFQLPETPMDTKSGVLRQSGSGKHRPQISSAQDSYREADWIVNAVRQGALPYVCRRHDGLSPSMDRVASLGNAVVPQVAEWIGRRIVESQGRPSC